MDQVWRGWCGHRVHMEPKRFRTKERGYGGWGATTTDGVDRATTGVQAGHPRGRATAGGRPAHDRGNDAWRVRRWYPPGADGPVGGVHHFARRRDSRGDIHGVRFD